LKVQDKLRKTTGVGEKAPLPSDKTPENPISSAKNGVRRSAGVGLWGRGKRNWPAHKLPGTALKTGVPLSRVEEELGESNR